MTALMVTILILLVVIVVWMIAMTVLYYSLFRSFRALKGMVEDTNTAQNDTLAAVVEELDSFLDIIKLTEDQAIECYDVAKKFVKDAEENKKIAMTTIKAVRQIKASMQTTSFLEQATAEISEETRFDNEEVNDEGSERTED